MHLIHQSVAKTSSLSNLACNISPKKHIDTGRQLYMNLPNPVTIVLMS